MTQQPPPGWGQQPPVGQQRPPPGWQPPPGWGPPQRPRQPMTAGRMALIMLGGLVGGVLGFFAPFLPGFLAQALLAVDIYGPGAGALLGLAMLITVPCGVVLGVLWARQKTRR
jgi:hypothetical protein